MIKLAVFATHPIQYLTPWLQLLAQQQGIDLTVYYGHLPDAYQQGKDFDISLKWDIPLLDGYKWRVLSNCIYNCGHKTIFRKMLAISRNLYRVKTDVAIITGWQELILWQAIFFCMWKNIPQIIRCESNAMRKRAWFIRYAHRLLLHRFRAFLAIGRANQAFYLQYGVPERSIFPCYYCVDNQRFLSQFQEIIKRRDQIRSEFYIPPERFCFLFVGKLTPKKRLMDLLGALKLAIKKDVAVHLLVVGTGRLMKPARTFVEKYQLPVTFAGFLNQNEIVRAYVAGDCLVLPSDFGETWGLVVNEAMVCGLPAIVSNRVGCGPDLIEEGVTGFVFPFSDINTLAEKMLITAFSKRYREMGVNARKRIMEQYSVKKAVWGTLEALKKCNPKSSII